MSDGALQGVSVLVAGAGLSGLTAARTLRRLGAHVVVCEARDRVGGRVWTVRRGFADRQHAEAGGDLIEDDQHAILGLAADVGLEPVRILRAGFAMYRFDGRAGRPVRSGRAAWKTLGERLAGFVRAFRLSEGRWDGAVAQALARQSVADWMDRAGAGPDVQAAVRGLRGFFLADPADLSLLALVEQFAADGDPGRARMYRLRGGNDRLAHALACDLQGDLHLSTPVVAVDRGGDRVRVSVRTPAGALQQIQADYLVFTVPAVTLRAIGIAPPLPALQQEAIARLKYGAATKVLAQFDRRFWRRPGRPRAFGTDLPIGAVWEGNEEQPGRRGILSLLGGGGASRALRALLAGGRPDGLLRHLAWLGANRARPLACHAVTWEDDPWAGGGYACFDPGFDPALRDWLARPCGRLLFAGEHTSLRWQGYMNGAVESGLRAAAEIEALARHSPTI